MFSPEPTREVVGLREGFPGMVTGALKEFVSLTLPAEAA